MSDKTFMQAALKEAEIALAEGEFPVGCVIVYENDIIASGRRTASRGEFTNELDHAEIVALRQLAVINRDVKKENLILYSTLEPCLMCFGAILLSGISKIVYAYEDTMGGATACDLARLPFLYKNAHITITPHILRSKSLSLFKKFFRDPENDYWRESVLSKYTLVQ